MQDNFTQFMQGCKGAPAIKAYLIYLSFAKDAYISEVLASFRLLSCEDDFTVQSMLHPIGCPHVSVGRKLLSHLHNINPRQLRMYAEYWINEPHLNLNGLEHSAGIYHERSFNVCLEQYIKYSRRYTSFRHYDAFSISYDFSDSAISGYIASKYTSVGIGNCNIEIKYNNENIHLQGASLSTDIPRAKINTINDVWTTILNNDWLNSICDYREGYPSQTMDTNAKILYHIFSLYYIQDVGAGRHINALRGLLDIYEQGGIPMQYIDLMYQPMNGMKYIHHYSDSSGLVIDYFDNVLVVHNQNGKYTLGSHYSPSFERYSLLHKLMH